MFNCSIKPMFNWMELESYSPIRKNKHWIEFCCTISSTVSDYNLKQKTMRPTVLFLTQDK